MYDPEEDKKLLSDLKILVSEKWNSHKEGEFTESNPNLNSDDVYITSSGLPISISHLDNNDKRNIKSNKSKRIYNMKNQINKPKNPIKPPKNDDSDSDQDNGRISNIINMTKN